MHPVITSRLTELGELCRRYDVLRLEVFGSAAGSDFDPRTSDLDFLVEFEPAPQGKRADQYFGFRSELERMFGRSIDLVEFGTIRNEYVLRNVEDTRRPVYVAA
jgi:uncharacterized protein